MLASEEVGTLWQPRELGDVIAERCLTLRRHGKRSKTVRVRFGKPVKSPHAERDPWWCPVQIVGLGSRQIRLVAGEDSLQALVLALKYVTRLLPVEAKRAGGRIDWLGDEERPVFGDTFQLEIQEAALLNLKSGLRTAAAALRSSSLSPSRRGALLGRLDRLIDTSGFKGHPAFKRKT